MGFQAGTQVNPSLGNADYSGFTNAANIQAQALSNFTQQIGEGIQNYQKNKTITATALGQLEGLVSANPDAYAQIKASDGDLGKSIARIEKGDYNQKDVLSALGAVNAHVSEKGRQQAMKLSQLEAQQREKDLNRPDLTGEVIDLGGGLTGVGTSPNQIQVMQSGGSANPKSIAKELWGEYNGNIPKEVSKNLSGETITEIKALERNFAGDPKDDPEWWARKEKLVGQERALNEEMTKWGSEKSADTYNKINNLTRVVNGLASEEMTTGNLGEFLPEWGNLRDTGRAFFKPTNQEAYDLVVGIVSGTLKESLGGNFTEREGERILNASYNPKASPEDNIRRLVGILSVMEATAKAKDARYEAWKNNEDMTNLPTAGAVFKQQLSAWEEKLQDEAISQGGVPNNENFSSNGVTIISKRDQ